MFVCTTWTLSPVHLNTNCSETVQKGHSWYVHKDMVSVRL